MEFNFFIILSVIHEKLINAYTESHKYKNVKPLSKHYYYNIIIFNKLICFSFVTIILLYYTHNYSKHDLYTHGFLFYNTIMYLYLYFFFDHITRYNNILVIY